MPTYQYACTACGHEFEAFQAFSDATLTDCPVCGGRLRKVYGSVGVVFKGSGFYRTDSRNGDGKIPAKSGDATTAKSTEKAASKDAGSSSSGSGNSGGSGSSGGSGGGSGSTGSGSGSGSSGSGSSGSGSGSSGSGSAASSGSSGSAKT